MPEFEVNLAGLKGVTSDEENVIKNLQGEVNRLDAVISSSALKRSGFGEVITTLKDISAQLTNEKSGVEELKKCLTEAIDLYEKTENNLAQGSAINKQVQMSIEKMGELLDALLKEEKYGENDDSSVICLDPVNMSTGNFIYDHTDLIVDGEIPLSFRRFYNALDSKSGTLGMRFLHNYEISLELKEGEQRVIVSMGDGQRKSFIRLEDGSYVGERASLETLVKNENGYQVSTINGEHYYFDENGVLLRQENQNGRGISFSYQEETGLLQKAENDNGSYLFYEYNEIGKLICVRDIGNREVHLGYEGDFLAYVQLADDSTISYSYTEKGRMETLTNESQNVVLKNYYEKDQRIVRQELPDGSNMLVEYDDATHRTTTTERNGSKTIYVQDEKYRNTDIIYEDGTTEHFEYNERNQKIKMVNRNGHACRMAYDHRGNLTQVVFEGGRKINYTYDGNNKILCIKVNGKEKMHNTYDAKGNLITAVSADGATNKATYDEMGRAVRLELGKGNVTKLSYDVNGNVEKITDAIGNETTYLYDRLGRPIETIDANGNKTSYEYDMRDRLTRVVNSLGLEKKYRYTATGKVAEMVDFDGYAIKASYNCLDKVECYTDKEGNETHFTYDKMWNVASRVTADGAEHRFVYNRDNRLESVYTPADGTITYTYDAVGNRTGITDAEGNHTAFSYDAANRVSEVTEANGAKTYYTYDEDGNLAKVTDACGGEWYYTYDSIGRRVSKTDPLGNTTSVCYNQIGKIERVCYSNGSSMVYRYEAGGRLAGIVRPDGTSENYSYDGNGNLIRRTNGLGESTTMEYDGLNRLISVTNPAGGRCAYVYDAVGHVIKSVDENGNQTRYEYSPNGKLIKLSDALGNETRYSYDCMGRLIKTERMGEVGEVAQETVYQWNLAGNVEEMRNPLGEVERYAYDKNGNLIEKIDRDGYRTTFGYNHAGKVKDILYADGREVKLSYNALNQLEEMTDWIGKTKIELDAMGRPLAITNPMEQTVGYEWGIMGEKTALVYPDGKRCEYGYDEAMHLTTLCIGDDTIRYQYDEAGRVKEKYLPGETTTRFTYNNLGRLAGIYHEGAEVKESYQYIYDVAGNKIEAIKLRSGMESDSGSFGYTYDALNRLIEVKKDGNVLRQYIYDAFGNRSRKLDYTGEILQETIYRYNQNNQLISELTGNTETSYRYDQRGNLTEVSQEEQLLKQFTFDAANRMTESIGVLDGSIKKAGYEYNGLGQRVGQNIWRMNKIQEAGITTARVPADPEQSIRYILDMTKQYHNLLQLEDAKHSKNQTFYWSGNVVSMEEAGEKSYYLQDDVGTPIGLLDGTGTMREAYGYDEFGISLMQESQRVNSDVTYRGQDMPHETAQPFGFTGYQMDVAGGFYFAQARRYDAGVGRFTSEDKVKGFIQAPVTLNPYIYCWNKPLELVDLNGMWPEWLENACDSAKETVSEIFNSVVGTDIILKEESVEEIECKVYTHTGGDIVVLESEGVNRGKITGISLNPSVNIPGTNLTIERSFSISLKDASDWEITTLSVKCNDENTNTYLSQMITWNKNGVNIKQETGGNSDTIPIEIANGIDVDSMTNLAWSGSVEKNITDWPQIVMMTVAVVGVALLTVDNVTGIGVADDGLAGALGTYIMSTCSSWLSVLSETLGTMAPALSCVK